MNDPHRVGLLHVSVTTDLKYRIEGRTYLAWQEADEVGVVRFTEVPEDKDERKRLGFDALYDRATWVSPSRPQQNFYFFQLSPVPAPVFA